EPRRAAPGSRARARQGAAGPGARLMARTPAAKRAERSPCDRADRPAQHPVKHALPARPGHQESSAQPRAEGAGRDAQRSPLGPERANEAADLAFDAALPDQDSPDDLLALGGVIEAGGGITLDD